MDDILLSIRVDGVDDLRKAAENMERFGKVAPKIAAQYDPVGKQVFRIIEANKKLSQTYTVLEGEQKRYAAMLKADQISFEEYRAQVQLLDKAMAQARREAEEYIKTDKELIAQQKKAAAAAKFRAQREEELYRKYAPARAAADQYKAELLDIEAALERNIIDLDEYNAAINRTKRDFELFTKGLATGGNQFAKFNVETYKSAQRLKRHFNQGVQQAGYQLGDFIVQVQSGQSALVALGQQGSQFAGIFGPTGAVVGAIIAGGTAAALAFQEYFGSLEGASKAVDKLNSSLDAFVSKARETYNSTKSIKEEYGDLTEELVNLAERAQEIRLRQVVLDAEELADSLKVTSNQFNRMFKGKTTADTTRNLQYMFKELSEASGPVEALEVIRRINEEVLRVGRGTENMAQAQLDFYSAGVAAEQAYEKVVRVLDLVPSKILQNEQAEKESAERAAEARIDSLREYGLAYEEDARRRSTIAAMQADKELEKSKALAESEARRIDQRFEKEAELFRQTVGMSDETRRRAGELSADERARFEYVAQAQAALLEENAKYEESQDKINAKLRELQTLVSATHKAYVPLSAEASAFKQQVEKSTSDFVDLVNKSNQLKKEIGDAAFEALRLGGVDIVSGVDAAAKAAAILAANMGMSLAAAMAMQAMTSQEDVAMSQPVVQGTVFDRFGVEDLRRFGFTDETLKRFGLLKEGRGGGAGGGKDPYQTAMDYLTTLQREAEFKQQLVGLSEQDQRRMELEYEFREKAEIGTRTLTDAENQRIESVLKAEMALKKAAEADQRRAQIQETISSNIESALMSVVDGTQSVEDAFKSMLRNIILEIYRQQVAKPFAESISSFIMGFFANGGVFRNGNVQPFANGGVVSSPSYFPMAGGKTGLMGEAGPEAIMPLKRGKNGKLGVQMEGGQQVVVNQSFNFQANGDESVKRIISQETPKIMEMTKAAVADARQRGGSYGRAFG